MISILLSWINELDSHQEMRLFGIESTILAYASREVVYSALIDDTATIMVHLHLLILQSVFELIVSFLHSDPPSLSLLVSLC